MARSTVHYADSSKNFEAKYRTLCKAAPADLDRLLSQLDPRHTLELDIARQFLSGLSAADLKKHPHLRTLSEIIQNLEQTEQISLRALLDQVVRPVKLDPGNSYKLVTVRLYGNGVHLRGAMLGDDIKGSNWFQGSNR